MKRLLLTILILFSSLALHSQVFYKALEPGKNQMAVYVGSYDWGPCINKIVINTEEKHSPDSIRLSDFEVERLIYQEDTGLGMKKGELSLTEAFTSDSKGNKITRESNYITILTEVYPTAENSSPFPGYLSSGVFDKFYNYRVENDELDIKITRLQGFVNEEVARFTRGDYEYQGETNSRRYSLDLPYMFYMPEAADSDAKLPLILWFHSIGESGKNPYLVLMGTKATNLAGNKIQSYFKDGAAILAPQCPTGWLETTETNSMGIRYWAPVDIDGPMSKITNPLKKFFGKFIEIEEEEEEPFAAVSYYTEPITELLMDFLEKHPEIDRKRIYVGGCSAGGYMTMNMMIQHPEIFAAAFPTCEYYLDSKISKKQIKILAEKPLWFTYAENDETVKPKNNCIPTIERLKAAGAKNLKVSSFPNVIDTSGKFLKNREAKEDDEDYGLPYEYDGHYSWVYVLNDECRDGNESLFNWLSQQKK